MIRLEVTYNLCGPFGAGCCVVEQFQEDGKIVGHGAVLRKCEKHSRVPDPNLVGVLHKEMAARQARLRKKADG